MWISASDWRRAAAVVRERNIRRRERGAEDGAGPGVWEGGRWFYAWRRSRRAPPNVQVWSPRQRYPGGCAHVSELVCAHRSGPGRQKVRVPRARWRQSFDESLQRALPRERGAGPAAQTPLWTRSAFITARLCGSSPSLVPYLFCKSPKETLAWWAGVSQRSRPGAENRGASSHHRKLKPAQVGGGRSGFSAALA